MTLARRILWDAGAPARLVLLGAIRVYQLTLSGWLGGQCRFSPTCSRTRKRRSDPAVRRGACSSPLDESCAATRSDEAGWIPFREELAHSTIDHERMMAPYSRPLNSHPV